MSGGRRNSSCVSLGLMYANCPPRLALRNTSTGMNRNRFSTTNSKARRVLAENGPVLLAHFILRKIFRRISPIRMTIHGHDIWVRPGTSDLEVAFESFGGEFQQLRALPEPLDGCVIIDAGAYVGYSSMALSEIFPNSRVYAIEPAKENFDLLMKNCSERSNIFPIYGAIVSSKDANREIRVSDRGAGKWGFTISASAEGKPVHGSSIGYTMMDLLKLSEAEDVYVLKMDIEGSERDVLLEAEHWISRIKSILVELHEDIHPDIGEVFQSACAGRRNSRSQGEKWLSIR
jgi:FkbM family methyltransferase